MTGPGIIAISGVSRGIGAALAREFSDGGWTVHGFGRSAPTWFEERPQQTSLHACDMADATQVAAVCGAFAGPLDVLICSAATFGPAAFHCIDFNATAFSEALAVNLVAPMIMARVLRPRLEEGARRLIIMMSTGNASLSGNTGGQMLAYRCSKSALNQAVRNLAVEWGPAGFTTVALNPGWVRTDMGGANAPLSTEEAAAAIRHFVSQNASPSLNGKFVNTDSSELPW